jgi:uncharacterized Fe-S center protein
MKNIVYFTENDDGMLSRLEKELKPIFAKGGSIAIKLHMGEVYNPNHLKPDFVRRIVALMKSMGLKPFLFDSPTKYSGPRHTPRGYRMQAALLGFSERSMGCPVKISNEHVESKGKYMTYQVCNELTVADGVLVLSHFKGHACSGMGGAIKNLGMGALTIRSKTDIHEGGRPELKGRCSLCRKCLQVCPQKCISYDEAGPAFNYKSCYGCSNCVQNCPSKCLKPRLAEFDSLLADGASSAQKKFRKFYYVSVMRRIANVCDCSVKDLHIVAPDTGIVMGPDACAVDHASVSLVNMKSGRDVFRETWQKDPLTQVREAERLGMGKTEYRIIDA